MKQLSTAVGLALLFGYETFTDGTLNNDANAVLGRPSSSAHHPAVG